MLAELTVIVRGDESTLRQKFLMYEEFTIRDDDPILKACISEAIDNFSGTVEDVKLRINVTL